MNELEKIRDILNRHIGKTNKVTSSQIANQIGIKEDDTHAKTRTCVLNIKITTLIITENICI